MCTKGVIRPILESGWGEGGDFGVIHSTNISIFSPSLQLFGQEKCEKTIH